MAFGSVGAAQVDGGAIRRDKALRRACQVCRCAFGSALHRQSFVAPSELAMPPSYEVVACRDCGFCFADLAYDQRQVDASYEAHSKYVPKLEIRESAIAERPPEAPFERERFSEVARYLASGGVSRRARILDCGCATGGFLAAMRAEGFGGVFGLDPSPPAVATARRVYGVEALAGSLTSPPPNLGTFEVVTLSHTLEHLADLRGAMRSLRELLIDDGIIYVEVPDAARYADYLVAPFQDFNTEHINHFSLTVLRRLMAEHRFVEVDAGTKLIECGPGIPYPALYGLWRKTTRPAEAVSIPRDDELPGALERYVSASESLLAKVSAGLKRDLHGCDEICVWGTGQLAMKLLGDSALACKRVRLLVDSSPARQGLHIAGARIGKPTDLKSFADLPVVVASVHQEASILASLREALDSDERAVLLFRPGWLDSSVECPN